MSGELCPGSRQPWSEDDAWFACAVCGMPRQEANAVDVAPPHTVDKATGEVWVQVAPPKPPEPGTWAVALRLAFNGHPVPWEPTGQAMEGWHRAAAEVRRLAATDPAIRAAHWREFGKFLSGCGYVGAAREASHQAELIERGEA